MDTSPVNAVGIIGGTGPMGRGLALRLGHSGLAVVVGSRDPARAEESATAIRSQLADGAGTIRGAGNREAAKFGELTLLTVPYQSGSPAVLELAGQLRGRVVVSTASPMEFQGGRAYPIRPEAGSATQEVAQLCPGARVVGAFHTVSAPLLGRLGAPLDEDILVTSDEPAAKSLVTSLIARIPGLRPVDGGGLENAGFSEGLTPFLIRLNRIHHTNTGIRVTGL